MKIFSIIVPVYNVEKYLNKCLDSLVQQEFDMNLVQIILIDDGSCDNSALICKDYVQKYPYFQYHFIPRSSQSGLGNARNYAMKYIKGEYFIFLDSDDYYSLDAFKILNTYINKYKQANLIVFDYQRVYEKQTLLQKIYQPNHKQTFHYGKLNSEIATTISHCAWNKVFKTNKYKNLRFDNCLYEDISLTTILFSEKNILIIEEVLYNYLIRKSSLMTQEFNLSKVQQNIKNYQKIESNISKNLKKEFYYRYLKYGYIFSIFTLSKNKNHKKLFKNYVITANELIKKQQLKKYLTVVEKIFFIIMNIKSKFIK